MAAVASAIGLDQARFASLEGLRGLMAWWVVFAHIAILTGINGLTPGFLGPLYRATIAVNVFIMLSGFVITHLQLSAARTSYGIYLVRRAFRLWPAYLVGLIPFLIVPALYSYPFVKLPWHTEHASVVAAFESVESNLLPHVALHLTMTHGIVPNEVLDHADSSLLSPAWSLSLEWQFYLIAPVLIALMLRSFRWAIAVFVGSAIVTAAFNLQTVFTWDFRSFLLSSLVFFAVGILSRIYIRELAALLRSWPSILVQFAAVVVALVFVDGLTDFTLGRELAIWLIALHAVAYEIDSTPRGRGANWIGKVSSAAMSWGPLRHLGRISYSTYILHITVICAWFWLLGRGDTGLSQGTAIVIGITSIVPIYGISLLSYRFVERPFMRYGNRLTTRKRATSPPAGVS